MIIKNISFKKDKPIFIHFEDKYFDRDGNVVFDANFAPISKNRMPFEEIEIKRNNVYQTLTLVLERDVITKDYSNENESSYAEKRQVDYKLLDSEKIGLQSKLRIHYGIKKDGKLSIHTLSIKKLN